MRTALRVVPHPEIPAELFIQHTVISLAERLVSHEPATALSQVQALQWSLTSRGHDATWLVPVLERLADAKPRRQ